jgi:N-acetyl-gamma-glutamyl-phosphate reductase
MKIGVIGASGYSGGELLRLLITHPHFELEYIAAGSSAGQTITSVHPGLRSFGRRVFEETSVTRMNECELVFIALPHGESAKLVAQIDASVKVVDLGADFRLNSKSSWEKYYGGAHAGTWSYGLSELPGATDVIATSARVSNPGCYATSIITAAAPAISAGIIDGSDIVVVASSGTTGAGRKPSARLLGSEVMGSLSSYKFGGVHQHTPEIEETLQKLTKSDVKVSFTPILAPMPRGILATTTAKLAGAVDIQAVRALYENFYAQCDFVTLLPEGELPATSSVVGSNSVVIQVAIDAHTNRLVISSAIDNLGKGASSQAVQNANIMCGFSPSLGLTKIGLGA